MTDFIDMGPVDAEILRVLRDECTLLAEIGHAPTHGKPYVLVTPIDMGADETALLLDSYRDTTYQLDYVAEGPEGVRWVQALVHEHFLALQSWDAGQGICGVTVRGASGLSRNDETTWVLQETLSVKVSNS